MNPMIVFRGVVALWFATWGLFAFLPESDKQTEPVVHDAVRMPIIVPASTVPPTTQPAPPQPDAPSTPSAIPLPLTSYWEKIAQCETESDWQHKGGNGAGHYYEGGLGIYDETWLAWGGGQFAKHAYEATKEQQIIVANRIAVLGFSETRTRNPDWAKKHGVPTEYLWEKSPAGFDGWGCNRRSGAPDLFYYPDPERFLTTAFAFNQRGVEVHDLQQLLDVKADGWYGVATRNAHHKYLVEANLPTDVVPPVPASSRSPRSGYRFVAWNGDVAEIPVDKTKRCPQYEAKFAQHGLPVEIFSFIAWRESRCNPKSENWTMNANGTSDHGLVQINSSWKTVTSQTCGSKMGDLSVLLDVDCNLKVAKRLLEISSNPLGNWNL